MRPHKSPFLLPIAFSAAFAVSVAGAAENSDQRATDSSRQIVAANNSFAIDLWKKAGAHPANLAISPASISAALTMTWSGAEGKTAEQMRSTLRMQVDAKTASEQWGRLIRALGNPSRSFTLRIANRLFGERRFTFEKPFLESTKANFSAELEPLDFAGSPDASRQRINIWVEDRTEHRITNLLPPRSIDQSTHMVLVNAIYFLAEWQVPFEKVETYNAPFFVTSSQKHNASTMHEEAWLRAAQIKDVKLLALDYKGGDAEMLFVLPDRVNGLADVEKNLDAKMIEAWTKALDWKQEVIVSLPRFKVDPPGSLSLSRALQDLGMTDAFDDKTADFDGMAKPKRPEDRLKISEVFHKAFVKVDEKGVEAAAATAATGLMATAAPPPNPKPPFVFKADHPFLFFIIDKPSGLILFMGRVTDPSAS